MSDYLEMLEALKKGGVGDPDSLPRMVGGGYMSPPRMFSALQNQPVVFPGLNNCVVKLLTQAYRTMAVMAEDEIAKGNDSGWGLLRGRPPQPDGSSFPCAPMDWPDLMSLRIAVDCDYNGFDKIELRSRSSTRSAMEAMGHEGRDGMGIHWPDRNDLDEPWWPPRVWAEAVVLCHLVKLMKESAK